MSVEIERGYFAWRQRLYYVAPWALLLFLFLIFISGCVAGLFCVYRMTN